MSITLYTAPDCIRCKIVKAFLAERGLPYDTVDFKADAPVFNTFYRTNRKAIYRNPEGVEFPLFDDGTAIRQGSGEIIAYLLSGHEMEACVTRSDMLHGNISGLYLSQCPDGQEDNFVTLADRLAKGGLHVWVQSDGRKPELLERLLQIKPVSVILNCVGPAPVYENLFGAAPSKEELAKSIDLVRKTEDGVIRFLAYPVPRADGSVSWPTRDEAAGAALLVSEAAGDHTLPYAVAAVTADMPQGLRGMEALPDAMLLKYRSAAREFLFKADIAK